MDYQDQSPNQTPRNPPTVRLPAAPPQRLRRFELAEDQEPGQTVYAHPRRWTGSEWVTDVRPQNKFLVTDPLGVYRGRGRNGEVPGSRGLARAPADASNWEIVDLQPNALLIRGQAYTYVAKAEAELVIDHAEVLSPSGGLIVDQAPPQAAEDTMTIFKIPSGYKPEADDVTVSVSEDEEVFAEWDESEVKWKMLTKDRLRFGKVQSGFTNADGTANRPVNVKSCLSDGTAETGDAFQVKTPIRPHAYTELLAGDVVGYLTDADGTKIIVTECFQSGWRCLATLETDITPESSAIPVTFLGLIVGPEPTLQYVENPLDYTAASGAVVELAYRSTIPEWFISSVAGAAEDIKVKVSEDDPQTDYLVNKLTTEDPWIGKEVIGGGAAAEQLKLKHTGPGADYSHSMPGVLLLDGTILMLTLPYPKFDARGHWTTDDSYYPVRIPIVDDDTWIKVTNDGGEVDGPLLFSHIGPSTVDSGKDSTAPVLSLSGTLLTVTCNLPRFDAKGHRTSAYDYPSNSVDISSALDEKVKAHAGDPTPGYLDAKIVGDGTWTTTAVVGNTVQVQHIGPSSTYDAFDPTPPSLTLAGTTLTLTRPFPEFDAKGHKSGNDAGTGNNDTVEVEGDGTWIAPSNNAGKLKISHTGPGSLESSQYPIVSVAVSGSNLRVTYTMLGVDDKGHLISSPGNATADFALDSVNVITGASIVGTDIVFTTKNIKVISDDGAGDNITLTGTACP